MRMHDKSCYWSMPPPQVSIIEEHVTIYGSAWEIKGARVNSIPKVLVSNKNTINCEVNKECVRVCLGSPPGNSILHLVYILVSLKTTNNNKPNRQQCPPTPPKNTPNQPNKKTHQKSPQHRDWTAGAYRSDLHLYKNPMTKSLCSEAQLKALKLKRTHDVGLTQSQAPVWKCFGPEYLMGVFYCSNLVLILKVVSSYNYSLRFFLLWD